MKIEDLIGLEVISSDARVVGGIEGVGLDVSTWTVPALKVGLKKGIEETIGVKKPLFGSAILYLKTDAIESISDMITLKQDMDSLSEAIMESETEMPTAGSVVNTRVIAKGGRLVGYLDNFIFNTDDDWTIPNILVRLDKSVIEDLGMKRSAFGSPVIKVLTEDVKTIGDMVILKVTVGELKDYLNKKPRKKMEESEEEVPTPVTEFKEDAEEEEADRRFENL